MSERVDCPQPVDIVFVKKLAIVVSSIANMLFRIRADFGKAVYRRRTDVEVAAEDDSPPLTFQAPALLK